MVVFIDVFELVEPYFLGEDEPIWASIFFQLGGLATGNEVMSFVVPPFIEEHSLVKVDGVPLRLVGD